MEQHRHGQNLISEGEVGHLYLGAVYNQGSISSQHPHRWRLSCRSS
jgi:hypothetical protein